MSKVRIEDVSIEELNDRSILFLYYLDSPTNFEDLKDIKENHICILNSNNDNKINNFLIAYINYQINNIDGYDYEVLRIFDDIKDDILKGTIKSMIPDNIKLFKYVDDNTLKEMSNDYMIPYNLLKKYKEERNDKNDIIRRFKI